jgi:hypothetical protein
MTAQTQDHGIRQDAASGYVSLGVAMAAADYPLNSLVEITDDYTVTLIVAVDKQSDGEVTKPATAAGGMGTIATRFRRILHDANANAAISAGAGAKIVADVAGVQTFDTFSEGVDGEKERIGVFLTHADAQGDKVDIGLY